MNARRDQPIALPLVLGFVAISFLWIGLSLTAYAAKNEAVGRALKILFEQGDVDTGSSTANQQIDKLKTYYTSRSFKPLWVRDNGPKGKAKALVAELRTARAHGLSTKFYNLERIDALFGSKEAVELAQLEMLLGGALVEFGSDLSNGRIRADVEGSMNAIRNEKVSAANYIAEAEATGNLRRYMTGLLQSDKRYVRLIAKLSEYLRMQYANQWPLIDVTAGSISKGTEDARLEQIRKLLVLGGDMPISAMNAGNAHDETSISAVKHFQTRHGLEADGELNIQTLAQMAVPIEKRIQQIQVNLERRRWQVSNVSDNHAYVNLADGSLRLVQEGKTIGNYKIENFQMLNTVPTFLAKLVSQSNKSDGSFSVDSQFLVGVGAKAEKHQLQIAEFESFKATVVKEFADPEGNVDLPIFVTYVTAWATRDGSIHFRNDVIGRDEKLANLLGLASK